MSLLESVRSEKTFYFIQRRELAEFFGYETRNKYVLQSESGAEVGFAAEQQKGILGFLFRQWFGHWRSFHILIYDSERRPTVTITHPFRLFFQRLEISMSDRLIGVIQQRFAFFSKCFDLEGKDGRVLLRVRSPLWSPWTFSFDRDGRRMAVVQKRWSGLFNEALTDADRFRIQFDTSELSAEERVLVLGAALFIDLQYFEKKAK
jgi:uncharacterized protein YxjI